MKRHELIAWGLVLVLSAGFVWQWSVASKQEGRAEEAEAHAIASSRHAEQTHWESNQIVAEATNHLDEREHEIVQLQKRIAAQIVARSAAKTITTPAIPEPAQPTDSAQVTEAPPQPQSAACDLLPEKIGEWPVAVCSMTGIPELVGVVPYPAAIEGLELLTKLQFTETKLGAVEAELTATKVALVDSQRAMEQWKHAAKKSRFKRFLGIVSKPALVVVGIVIGRAI